MGGGETRALARPGVDRQRDPEAHLPHRVETAPVHRTATRNEIRQEVLLRQRDPRTSRLDRPGNGRELRAPVADRLEKDRQTRHICAESQTRRCLDPSVLRAREHAVDFRAPVGDLRRLLRPRFVYPEDLDLRPQHVLLDADADRIPLAHDVGNLAPGPAPVLDQLEQCPCEQVVVVGAPHPGLDGQASPTHCPLLDLLGAILRLLPRQTQLSRPRQGLREHRSEKRHVLLAERGRLAVVLIVEGQKGVGQRPRRSDPKLRGLGRGDRARKLGVLLERLQDESVEKGVRRCRPSFTRGSSEGSLLSADHRGRCEEPDRDES